MARAATLDRLYGDVGELLDRHDDADLSAYAPYRDDPIGFVREVLGESPWDRQVEIAEAVLEEPQVTVRSCHAAGKDWLAARLALWWCYARRGLVLLTGPTRQQVEEILMRGEIRDAFRRGDLPGDLHVKALRPGGKGRAGILAKTATGVSALTGFHEARVLFMVTEAQDPEIEHAWDAAFACTTGAEDRVLTLGNPTEPDGRFWRAHRPGSDWRTVKIAAEDVPNVRAGETVVPGLLTREGVERFRREYGEESPFYVSRVLAAFPETSEDGLVEAAWIERAFEAHREGAFSDDASGSYATVAVDVARYGSDATVVAVRRGRVVTDFHCWTGKNTRGTAARVMALVRAEHDGGSSPVEEVVVDATAVGGGVADSLREELPEIEWYDGGPGRSVRERTPRLTEFVGGERAPDHERFRNLRSQAFWRLREWLEAGELALPDDEDLRRELLAHRYEVAADGRTAIVSKDEVKARLGGSSPDRADALSMTLAPELEEAGAVGLSWI